MSPMDIITSYVEGKLSSAVFLYELYHNKDLESALSESIGIAPYIESSGGLYFYLLSLDIESPAGKLNSIDALSRFLVEKGVSFTASKTAEKTFDLLLKVQPKWLSIPDNYLRKLISDNEGKTGKELEQALRQIIKDEFCCLEAPPEWLQSANWPIENDKPLMFIGQIDASKLFHDETQVYIFYNREAGVFTIIKQSA